MSKSHIGDLVRERVKRAVSQVRGFLNWERLVFLEKNEENF
jgi:hypothetical protein